MPVGVVPTPAIAYFAQRDDAAAAVISASHNAWSDNGVKLMAAGGRKLPDEVEAAIEDELRALLAGPPAAMSRVGSCATASTSTSSISRPRCRARTLEGMRVVVDCANGAASRVVPRALRHLGADVIVLHAEPDGRNINEQCGSTYPESLQAAVRAHEAEVGLALDGDADRVIAVDERGELVDGDQIMTALAIDLDARGALRQPRDRRDGDVEPRVAPGPGVRGHRDRRDAGRRPQRARARSTSTTSCSVANSRAM